MVKLLIYTIIAIVVIQIYGIFGQRLNNFLVGAVEKILTIGKYAPEVYALIVWIIILLIFKSFIKARNG